MRVQQQQGQLYGSTNSMVCRNVLTAADSTPTHARQYQRYAPSTYDREIDSECNRSSALEAGFRRLFFSGGQARTPANMVIPCAARRVATSGSGRRQSTEQSGASASFASAAASAASGGPPAPVSCSRACVECVDDVCCASI
eukprot:563932-Pleurochrysis_carterae.AAC.1